MVIRKRSTNKQVTQAAEQGKQGVITDTVNKTADFAIGGMGSVGGLDINGFFVPGSGMKFKPGFAA